MTDKQLLKCAAQFRKGILGNGKSAFKCFMVSAPLAGLLEAQGIPNILAEGRFSYCNHFWIEFPDGRVLDPTADQFNHYGHTDAPLPPVYLGLPTVIHSKMHNV